MKIQCDVCERNQAIVICCADEAALCEKCDIEVHAANKLASKHQRLQLHCISDKSPSCDICQEKPAFIFCVEDRALFCQNCDESIHPTNTLAANHQRYLATGIRVALGSSNCRNETIKNCKEPSNQNVRQLAFKQTVHPSPSFSPPASWAVDDLLDLTRLDSPVKKSQLELGEIDWWSDVSLFGEQIPHEALTAAEVPQLPMSVPNTVTPDYQYRPPRDSMPYKKPRIEICGEDDDDEYLIVPNLG